MTDGIYVIEYKLRGTPRSFVIRHPKMNSEDAWHWACCDAGVGVIPRFSGERNFKKVTRLTAERYGIEDVRWRPSA